MKADITVIIVSAILSASAVAIDAVSQVIELKTIEANQNAAIESWRIKLALEQDKAEQARYRAMEVGYPCEFSTRSGEVYLNKNCE